MGGGGGERGFHVFVEEVFKNKQTSSSDPGVYTHDHEKAAAKVVKRVL